MCSVSFHFLLFQGLLLNFKPEVFSSLKVFPIEEEPQPLVDPDVEPSSAQSSGSRSTTSISTEELELSTLLSKSSSSGEDSLQSSIPSPIDDTAPPECSSGGDQAKAFGGSPQEEAYVTMSSFYQVK